MLIVLGAMLGFAPWGIRTHNVYGSPFYPYGLSGSYNSPNTELLAQKKLISKFYSTMYAGGHVFNPAKPWWQNVLVLVTGKSKYVANRIGPLFFGLLPLILFSLLRREGRSETVWAITLVGVTMVLWFIIIKLQVWYVLYIFPLWSAMLASASTHIRQRWFIPFVVIVLSVVSLMHVSYARAPLLLFYGNALSEAQYDAIFGPGISLNTYLNTVVRAEYPRYVVFPMGEHRQVFLEDNDLHLYADNRSLSAWVPLALSSMTDDQINAWFLKKGITHAYSVYADIEEWRASWCPTITTPKDPCPQFDPVMQRFYQLASKWTIVSQNEDWVLYKVQ
jgi:hypothetical protein